MNKDFNTIEEALEELRNGKMIIVVDDPDRENEGDLICAAEFAHNDYYVEPEKVVENIIAMCDIANANGIVPIISSIPPCSGFPWRQEIENPGQTIVNINKSLKTYAENNGIIYVDYHSALADKNLGLPENLSDDGCHPNPDTYLTMESLVMKAVRSLSDK